MITETNSTNIRDNYITQSESKNSNEFVLGRGFTNKSASSSLKKIFENVTNIAGYAVISYLLCEHLLNFLIAKIVSIFVPSISVNIFTGNVSINSNASFILMILLTLLKFSVALAFLGFGFKSKFYGLKYNKKAKTASKDSIVFSFGLTAVCAGIVSLITLIPKIYHTNDYITTMILNNENLLLSNVPASVFFIFVWTVIISAFIENIIHSSLFTVSRRLSDFFAIIYFAVTSIFFVQSFSLIIPMFIISIFLGFSALKTNSVVICTIQRVIINFIAMAAYYLSIDSMENFKYILIIAVICIILGIVLLAVAGAFKSKPQPSAANLKSKLESSKFSSLKYAFHCCTPCIMTGTTLAVVLFLVGCIAGVSSGL